jgi:hypothetical protein
MLNTETIGEILTDKIDLYLANPKVGNRFKNLVDKDDPSGESPGEFFRGMVVKMLNNISQTDEEVVLETYCNGLDPQRGKI